MHDENETEDSDHGEAEIPYPVESLPEPYCDNCDMDYWVYAGPD